VVENKPQLIENDTAQPRLIRLYPGAVTPQLNRTNVGRTNETQGLLPAPKPGLVDALARNVRSFGSMLTFYTPFGNI